MLDAGFDAEDADGISGPYLDFATRALMAEMGRVGRTRDGLLMLAKKKKKEEKKKEEEEEEEEAEEGIASGVVVVVNGAGGGRRRSTRGTNSSISYRRGYLRDKSISSGGNRTAGSSRSTARASACPPTSCRRSSNTPATWDCSIS